MFYMTQPVGNQNVHLNDGNALTSSLENLLQCPRCIQPRFFKNQRGLNIHIGKIHKPPCDVNLIAPSITQSIISNNSVDTEPFWKKISNLKSSLPLVKRIPRGARITVARTFSQYIQETVNTNSQKAWENLLILPYKILNVKKDNNKSLTTLIKNNCNNMRQFPEMQYATRTSKKGNNLNYIIESKLSEGDINGAAQLLFSSDELAPNTPDTLSALIDKHPSHNLNDSPWPNPPDVSDPNLTSTTDQVLRAVLSFRSGSAGGLDGLTPQHLKDLVQGSCGDAGETLLKDITALVNLMLSGTIHENITDLLYGANLCALIKKDGGIRPIAVGTTYRRIAAKICVKSINLTNYFQPHQLGFGSKGGCEAAVHSLRTFVDNNINTDYVILKLDIKNAFNSIDRGALLTQVKDKIPNAFRFIWQCYSKNSKLIYFSNLLHSSVGCQQGDPLGPAIFSLGIHPIIQNLTSKYNVWYLDDGTLGGEIHSVLNDFKTLIQEFKKIGLDLNYSKCELFFPNSQTQTQEIENEFNILAPGIKIVTKDFLRLLGSPVFDESIPNFIQEKIQNFHTVSDRIFQINSHMAFYIIRHCLFVPKFIYFLRCSPIWKFHNILNNIDNVLKNFLSKLLNINLDENMFIQASLPIRFGGLGIRKISSVSLPAFLSSVYSVKDLVGKILNPSHGDLEISHLAEARNAWCEQCPSILPPITETSQKLWDEPLCKTVYNTLLTSSNTVAERARLLAVAQWESGLWLQALPSSKTGTLMDQNSLRLAICLRLGATCFLSHRCQCGEIVVQPGYHGLSCHRSSGRISRHANINEIIRRAFASASIPAVLEPNGLARDDGKRPDGMTLVPWSDGKCLVWDATCGDTFAPSHLPGTAQKAGAAASALENLKRRKYAVLSRDYIFEPFGVETMGPWGPGAHKIFKYLSKRLVDASGDQRAGSFLGQRISIAIQRGNAASLLGTLPIDSDLREIFYLV